MTSASQNPAIGAQTDASFPASGLRERAASRRPRFGARMSARVSAFFNRLLPYGYEDETGFHYGQQPPPPKPHSEKSSSELG